MESTISPLILVPIALFGIGVRCAFDFMRAHHASQRWGGIGALVLGAIAVISTVALAVLAVRIGKKKDAAKRLSVVIGADAPQPQR